MKFVLVAVALVGRPADSAGCGAGMYYVYILQSQIDGSLYKGFSRDIKSRIKWHNDGKNTSTKSKKPWKVIYYEGYISKEDAMKREKFLKSGRGREVIKKQLGNTLK